MTLESLDWLLNEHLNFEAEQVHVLTALYGIACANDATEQHLRTAKCLELMKASTLILDDFLDKSPERNGLPSIYKANGAEHAVLTAEILHSTALIEFCEALDGLSADALRRSICLFEETYRTVCIGQLKDKQLETVPLGLKAPSENDYFDMIKHTSAIFIQLPLLLGAHVANRPNHVIHALGAFGLDIGLAYQVRDDVLDIIAPVELTGKPRAGDIRTKKKRLPIMRLRDALDGTARGRLLALYGTPGELQEDAVQEIIRLIEENDVIDSCKRTTVSLCSKALGHLQGNVSHEEHDQLEAVAGLLTDFHFLRGERVG